MIPPWMGIAIGTFTLVVAACAMIGHYRMEYRRTQRMRIIDCKKPQRAFGTYKLSAMYSEKLHTHSERTTAERDG